MFPLQPVDGVRALVPAIRVGKAKRAVGDMLDSCQLMFGPEGGQWTRRRDLFLLHTGNALMLARLTWDIVGAIDFACPECFIVAWAMELANVHRACPEFPFVCAPCWVRKTAQKVSPHRLRDHWYRHFTET